MLLACTALVAPGFALAQVPALPQGGQFVAGQGSIGAASGNALTITQTSARGVIDWRSFNIGQGASVTFNNGAGATLNRVTGGDLSQILGSLRATGSLYLINPQGVVIGSSGVVVTGGRFVASSLDVANDAFMAGGTLVFRGTTEHAEVRNLGNIASTGGDVILISRAVRNEGTITAPRGTAALAAGTEVLLREGPEGHRGMVRVSGASGDVTNAGHIEAAQAELRAAGGNIYALAGNTAGVIRATGTETRNGRVWLSAGAGTNTGNVVTEGRIEARNADGTGGKVTVRAGNAVLNTGTIAADGRSGGAVRVRAARVVQQGTISARGTSGAGGTVRLLAEDIALTGAQIDASGASGGGVVRIGGGYQGGEGLPRASTVAVDAATKIRADATQRGNGGDVVVWSDNRTDFAGAISARGGAEGGDGGQAEVSSRGVLNYTGNTDLRAPLGAWGTLLLDPYNITISTGAQTTGSGFTADADDSVINATVLLGALATANVTVSTGLAGSAGSQAGNITVTAPLSWTSPSTLTLQANSAINLNAAITASAGGLALQAGGTIGATGDISVGRFELLSGNWTQSATTLAGLSASDFRLTGGTFLRAVGGAGTSGNPWLLTDIFGVQGMATRRSEHYRLGNDIAAAGTASWNNGAGFQPIGASSTPFTGRLDGAGRVITGLFINRPTLNDVGLFGRIGAGSSISNVGLVGGSVTGRSEVGGLVGYAENLSTITQAYATAAVSGTERVGGLVGVNINGTITRAYATGNVTGTGTASNLGGLVGVNINGTITQVYATGTVTGSSWVGGLIGTSTGGTITQAYASGAVSGSTQLGGLVGDNTSTITASFWDTQTTGRTVGVGLGSTAGVTGLTTAQSRSQAGYTGWNFTTDWFHAGDLRPIGRWEAAQPGTDSVRVIRNLNQLQLMAANLGGSYRLGNDIDAAPTNATASSPGIWGAGGFMPVGASAQRFTGSLDGASRVITGLTINRPTQNGVGLFGAAANGSTIRNIGLVGGSVTGTNSVGGLVGDSNATIIQAYATGALAGVDIVGGLVGFNRGTITQSYTTGAVAGRDLTGGLVGVNEGMITESHTTGAASGRDAVGGLLGWNQNTGSLTESFAVGAVAGTSNIGGLVGFNRGTIAQAYATGPAVGDSSVGGLVGYAAIGTITNTYATGAATGRSAVGGLVGTHDVGTITRAYATGAVTGIGSSSNLGGLVGRHISGAIIQAYATGNIQGSTAVGGLVGTNTSGTITASFWDTETTGRSLGVGSGSASGATGRPTAQARSWASYTGWDFTTDWFQAGDMRPIGRWEAAQPGTDSVRVIRNLNQLQLMATNLSASYRLGTDINAAPTNATSNSPGIWGAGGFVPVGDSSTPFIGTFDGAGRVISGLTINRPTQDWVGLFGAIGDGSSISNIGLLGGSVHGKGGVGGLVGQSRGAITQAYATTAVTGDIWVGGLVGISNGTITQAYASGAVTGRDYVGGLVGSKSGTLTQAYATGAVTVTGPTANVGGLIGENHSTISGSFWDTQTTGRSIGVGSGSADGAFGRTTAELQDIASFRTTYAGWDFDTVWSPPNQVGQNNGAITAFYPQLYSLSNVVAVFVPDASRRYGDANPPLGLPTYRGLRLGDTIGTPATLSNPTTATSNVGTHALTASGTAVTSSAGRTYRMVHVPGTLTITPRPVTLTGSRVYDGDTSVAGAVLSVTNLVGSDTLTLTGASSVASPHVAAGQQTLTLGTLALGGASAANYTLTGGSGTATITARPVTLTGSRVYDGSTDIAAAALSVANLVGGDTLTLSGTGSVTSPHVAAGAQVLTLAGLTLGGASASNYTLAGGTGSATITARPVTLTGSRVYDGSTDIASAALSVTNMVGTDTLTLSGAGSVASPHVAAGAQVLTLAGLTLGGASAANYTLTAGSGTATITARPVTLTGSRVYDGGTSVAAAALSVANLVGGDTLSLTGAGSVASPHVAAGAQALTLTGLTLGGASASNYTLTGGSGTATITARPLTVSADAQSRVYGDANPALTFQIGGQGLVPGDTLTGALATTATATSPVGPYAISRGDITAGSNYALSFVPNTLSITPRPVTLTGSRVYDGSTDIASAALSVTNLVGSDTLTLSGAGSVASPHVAAGAQVLTLAGLTLGGASAANYTLAGGTGSATITARPVTLTGSRVYDGSTDIASAALSVTNLINGDTLTLSGAGSVTSPHVAAGQQTLTFGTLALGGASAANYTLTGGAGTAAITARPLTVFANAQSRVYGDANPALTVQIGGQGLVPGDTLTGALATTATTASPVGPYAISLGDITAGSNYALSFVPNTLSITQRPVSLTGSRVYDGGTSVAAAALSVTNLVGSDTLSLTGAGSVASPHVAAGQQTLTLGTLALGGASAANYTLTAGSGTATITARPVTLTGSRVYDGSTDIAAAALSVTNLVGSDTLTLSGAGSVASPHVAAGAQALTLTGLTLGGASAANYTLTGGSGTATITARPLTVTADAQSRVYGDANPSLTLQLGGQGLVPGDTLTGALATTATTTSPVGPYAISLGNITAGSNYALSFVPNTLSITPRPVIVTADDLRRVQGQLNPVFTFRTTGLVAGDTPGIIRGLELISPATASARPGAYAITPFGGSADNYTLVRVDGILTIEPAADSLEGGPIIGTSNAPPPAVRFGPPEGGIRPVVSGSGAAVPLRAASTGCGAGVSVDVVGCGSGFPVQQN